MSAQKAKTCSSSSTATAQARSPRSQACARARSPSTPRRWTSRTRISAGQWRELLAGAGVKNAKVSGAGVFKDAASDALVRSYVFAGTISDWQVIIPDFGTVQGPFQIASFELSGRHDGEVAFDLSRFQPAS